MSYQIIYSKDGEPEFVLVPIDDYEDLVLAKDAAAMKAKLLAGETEALPQEFAYRIMDGENAVKVWRDYRGYTQDELVAGTGLTQAAISQIENNKRNGSTENMVKIAKFLKLSIEDLID